MEKKYELLMDTQISVKEWEHARKHDGICSPSGYGKTLYRIRALRDFGDVKKGDIGGFVCSEDILSHDGNCWIYDDAAAWGKNITVKDNAKLRNVAELNGNNIIIADNSIVSGSASVCTESTILGASEITRCSTIWKSRICDFFIGGNSVIHSSIVIGVSPYDFGMPLDSIYDCEIIGSRIDGRNNFGLTLKGFSRIISGYITSSKDVMALNNFRNTYVSAYVFKKNCCDEKGIAISYGHNEVYDLVFFDKGLNEKYDIGDDSYKYYIPLIKNHFADFLVNQKNK